MSAKNLEKRDLKMYVLVNENIQIGKGRLAGQVGHAVNVYVWENRDSDKVHEYMSGSIKKIILFAPQITLEQLEFENYTAIREDGIVNLESNVLTCVNIGILDYASFPNYLEWIRSLELVY